MNKPIFVVRPFQATTLSWWHSERDNLDLSPPYQRSPGVWSIKDKAYLIDSIINGFDIPKFYIADFSYVSSGLNITGKPYAVIDGRQRFEAIFDFLDGNLRLNKSISYLGDEPAEISGLNYLELKELYPKIAQRVENFNITVMSVITNREPLINELFVRLNRNKPLTGAEVRSAMTGEIPKLIRDIAQSDFLTRRISFNTTRKQNENVAAKLLLIEHRGGFVETKKVNLDRFAMEANLTESTFAHSAERVHSTLAIASKVFRINDNLLKSSGAVPVYYWLVRNLERIDHRKSIESFEFFRRTNKSHPAAIAYSEASRSTNDPISYRTRYDLLEAFALSDGNLAEFDVSSRSILARFDLVPISRPT